MLYPYAVCPEVIDSYERFLRIYDQCGLCHGRMIVEYPADKWKARIRDHIRKKKVKPVERQKIETKLERISTKTYPVQVKSPYDNGRLWLENAERADVSPAFYGIIAKNNPRSDSRVIPIDSCDNDNELWNVDTARAVPATASDMANWVEPLVSIGRRLLMVDPYFKPNDPNWYEPLSSFILAYWRGVTRGSPEIEYHTAKKRDESGDWFGRECTNGLRRLVPKGAVLRVVRWDVDLDQPHDRYVLTDLGGYSFGRGLEESKYSVTISLITDAQRRIVSGQYGLGLFSGEKGPTLTKVDQVEVIGTMDC